MSRATVLKSFADLAEVFDLTSLPEGPAPARVIERPTIPVVQADPVDLAGLLTELEASGAALSAIARGDQEERALALKDLDRYDLLVDRQREAEQVRDRARQMRSDAEALAENAFAEEARAEASRIAALAAQVEAAAEEQCEALRREIERLAAGLDVERLLWERRRQQEAEQAKAAEAERARRLSGALAAARQALAAGQLQEARELLGSVASDNPDNAEIASLRSVITQRELTVKIAAAEAALWGARREHRQDPAAAVARLAALDIEELPEPLLRQIFGEWARACARLCRTNGLVEPLRYAPDPGHGAVIAREVPDGEYTVISALGMGPGWQPGRTVNDRQLRRARPLR